MIAVIKGDIVSSRKVSDAEQWLIPLKACLQKWAQDNSSWDIIWGDSFQIQINNPSNALKAAIDIKTSIKSIATGGPNLKYSKVDVRMAIGIGTQSHKGEKVSESNGTAFILASNKFEHLKKDKTNLAIETHNDALNKDLNLYLRLANTIMDNWTISSAEIMNIYLNNQASTQDTIGKQLKIKQNAVSSRKSRAKVSLILDLIKHYQLKIKEL